MPVPQYQVRTGHRKIGKFAKCDGSNLCFTKWCKILVQEKIICAVLGASLAAAVEAQEQNPILYSLSESKFEV